MAERLVSRDDLIRDGLCYEGVYRRAHKVCPHATAVPVSVALRAAPRAERQRIARALGLNGDSGDYCYVGSAGAGIGRGYGYGDIRGDGEGCGSSYGNAYGGGGYDYDVGGYGGDGYNGDGGFAKAAK